MQNELYKELYYINHSREKRANYAQLIIAQPHLMQYILEILFMVDDPRSNRAGWLAEFVTKEEVTALYPYLEYFPSNMHRVYKDSATPSKQDL